MKILILGANGYIGSNLTLYLSSRGYRIYAGIRNRIEDHPILPNVDYCHIDLSLPSTYRDILKEVDSICYLIGPGSLFRQNNPGELIRDYLLTFSNFLEENSRLNNCPIVFTSSGGTVYGGTENRPSFEGDALNPSTPYGLLKKMSEQLLDYYHENFQTPYIALRISNPYGGTGHNKLDQGVINIFIKRIYSMQPIEVWGDGSSVRDFIYVDDLMSAFEASLAAKNINLPINIGSGVGTTLLEICNIIGKQSNIKFKINHNPKNPKIIDYSVLNINLAKKLLRWQPSITIDEGISRAIDQYI